MWSITPHLSRRSQYRLFLMLPPVTTGRCRPLVLFDWLFRSAVWLRIAVSDEHRFGGLSLNTFHRDKLYAAMWETQRNASRDCTLTITLLSLSGMIWSSENPDMPKQIPIISLSLDQHSAVCCVALLCAGVCSRFVWLTQKGTNLFARLMLTLTFEMKTGMQQKHALVFAPFWQYPSFAQMIKVDSFRFEHEQDKDGNDWIFMPITPWRLWMFWFSCMSICLGQVAFVAKRALGLNFPTVALIVLICVGVYGNVIFFRWKRTVGGRQGWQSLVDGFGRSTTSRDNPTG